MNGVITVSVPHGSPALPQIKDDFRTLVGARRIETAFDGTFIVSFSSLVDYDGFVDGLSAIADAFSGSFFFAAYIPAPGVLPSLRKQ